MDDWSLLICLKLFNLKYLDKRTQTYKAAELLKTEKRLNKTGNYKQVAP